MVVGPIGPNPEPGHAVNPSPQKPSAIICPGCRKLINADDVQCPYCRLKHPGGGFRKIPGGRLAKSPENAIRWIIYVNVAFFILSILIYPRHIGMSANPLFFFSIDTDSLILLGATGTLPIDRLHRWWTLVSASYLHGSLLHIFFNMAALSQLGKLVTREFGVSRMFAIYTVGGAAGFLASYIAGIPITIGASASLCALMGAALYYGKHRGGVYGAMVYRQISGWIVSLAIFGLVVSGINNWGHGGGLLGGIAMGWLLGYNEQRPETPGHRWLAGLCLWGTVAILAWAACTGLYYRLS
jgi:rhomboid protease GluP